MWGAGNQTGLRVDLLKPPAGPSASSWRFDASISGGGLFVDVGSHQLDLLHYMLAPLQNVSGMTSKTSAKSPGGVEDNVRAM